MSNLISYETSTGSVELNNNIVRQVIAKGDGITDAEIFSFRRITLAPIIVLAGFIFEIWAIMKKPRSNSK